jgi:histidyl-tRNA synthetase
MKIKSVRGMNDISPPETASWQYLEKTIVDVLSTYAFQEIRFPILEHSELFRRSIGNITDIVEKEMYSFDDRNGDNLSLRPEGTAGCVRACVQQGLLHNQTQRLWYKGPMFRHERPQKGRQREFHQIGVEAFGFEGPELDAELLIMMHRLWSRLRIDGAMTLEINSLGQASDRARYRVALVDYLEDYREQLDDDSQRRLTKNPMRILDSKNIDTQKILADAPRLEEFIDDTSRVHFDRVCGLLSAAGVEYEINDRLVRGLDYYSKTVFEWVTNKVGAQGTICGGGRFDDLIEQIGGKPGFAIGLALGMERLLLLVKAMDVLPDSLGKNVDVYLVAVGNVSEEAFLISEQLRSEIPGLRVEQHCGPGGFRSQLKKADKSGARLALIIGEDECSKDVVGVKFLREHRDQEQVDRKRLMDFMQPIFI